MRKAFSGAAVILVSILLMSLLMVSVFADTASGGDIASGGDVASSEEENTDVSEDKPVVLTDDEGNIVEGVQVEVKEEAEVQDFSEDNKGAIFKAVGADEDAEGESAPEVLAVFEVAAEDFKGGEISFYVEGVKKGDKITVLHWIGGDMTKDPEVLEAVTDDNKVTVRIASLSPFAIVRFTVDNAADSNKDESSSSEETTADETKASEETKPEETTTSEEAKENETKTTEETKAEETTTSENEKEDETKSTSSTKASDDSHSSDVVVTGDEFNGGVWIMLSVISLIAGGMLLIVRKYASK